MMRVVHIMFLCAVATTLIGPKAAKAQESRPDPASKPSFVALLTSARPSMGKVAPPLKAFTEPKPRATPVKPRERPF
ncbi:MAG: hypothetical protein AB7I30_12180 [Isosphaeraceae bacterium]